MSSSSSTVLRSKEKMVKTQPSDIICPCGGQTIYKQSETKANPGRWYLRCIGGCGFLRWADVGEEQGCPICREPECNPEAIAENEKENDKAEDVVTAEEPDSYVYFEDQDSEVL
ncbi:putative transcription factor GRF family [Helianthus annuus]|nr:putative transcription factor GRF family [Helianthus annuus]